MFSNLSSTSLIYAIVLIVIGVILIALGAYFANKQILLTDLGATSKYSKAEKKRRSKQYGISFALIGIGLLVVAVSVLTTVHYLSFVGIILAIIGIIMGKSATR